MTVQSTRFLGRPILAAPMGSVRTFDKWAVVDALTQARAEFDLSHRAIAVLRALLTFVPERDLPAVMGKSIVFASNATLSDRLGGMPESTLRRHLAALVAAGVIARFDSPNRKRYVKRLGGGIACAFGFDLGPLMLRAQSIDTAALAATRREEETELMRTAVLLARRDLVSQLIAQGVDVEQPHELSPLLARTRLMLRHKDNALALATLLEELKTATESSATDSENERHYYKKNKLNSDSEGSSTPEDEPLALDPSLGSFKEYRKFYPNGAQCWQELMAQTEQLVPMMGIEIPVYKEATRFMGSRVAVLVALGILERFDSIENHGGYMRRLTQEAKSGRFNIQRFLRLSADNA